VVVVLMGVAGSGKSFIGRMLATELGCRFVDADDYHSRGSIMKMRRGVPLEDADREPWLESLRRVVARAIDRREHLVVACSALRERYREVLSAGFRPVRFVHLVADEATLNRRLELRIDHFAGVALLGSQLATLEPPVDALTVDATCAPDRIVTVIRREFGI
jgi:gluconokinase